MTRTSIAALVLFATANVWGHAEITRIDPPDGSVLDDPPSEIVVHFTEDVTPIRVNLIDAERAQVDIAFERIVDDTLRVTLPVLDDGLYLFSFRIASADGHPVAKSIAFRVGAGSDGAATTVPSMPAGTALPPLSQLLRALATALVLVCVGLFMYRRWLAPGNCRLERPAQSVTLVVVLGSLLLFIPAYSGIGFGVYADWPALAVLIDERVVRGQLLFAAAFITFVVATRRGVDGLAVAAIAGIALGKSSAGHTVTAGMAPLPSIMLIVHVLIVAFWTGSLLCLYRIAGAADTDLLPKLRRFSAIALPLILLLVATGLAMAWLIIEDWLHVLQERYGLLLLAKLFLVAVVCAIALRNRRTLTPRLAAADVRAAGQLRSSMVSELAIIGVILIVTSVLAVTTPSTRYAATAAKRAQTELSGRDYTLRIEYETVPGGSVVVVPLRGDDVIDVMEIALRWQDPAGALEPINRDTELQDGQFVSALPEFPLDAWLLEAELLIDDFTSVRIRGEVPIR